ncbi:oligogalacturonate lyase family protein [Coraliomargarita parva]|uniref:oligogalacturonate lyase family protein n=1 Tax=Coraliomargarita parva TaxID=3014050 RepID=UPI0022B57898|nr:oligogalacturonate lyase family protein [Coraliomargarita parva]
MTTKVAAVGLPGLLLSEFNQNRYLTYPHCNGFTGDGALVVGQLEENSISLWKIDYRSGEERFLARFEKPVIGWLAFDVALESERMAVVVGQELWILDMSGKEETRCIYTFDTSEIDAWDFNEKGLHPIPSLSKDGTQVVVCITLPGKSKVLRIDVAGGTGHCLFEKPWWITHAHFCHHDENWIGFCHEGPAEKVHDRVWGWHETLAPDGVLLFDQRIGDSGESIYLGHERWALSETAAYVVAYGRGISPVGPCGLYKLSLDASGRARVELVRQSDRYWHCNVSRDGRWAVVDTTGPYDAPGTGWENAGNVSDVLLIDLQDGSERLLARSARSAQQTAHPHPTFAPDNATVFFNEASPCGAYSRVRAKKIL